MVAVGVLYIAGAGHAGTTFLKERRTQIVIRAADSWRQEKHANLHAMAERLTFPYAQTLGYEKGVSA